jgi:hypothetical protein
MNTYKTIVRCAECGNEDTFYLNTEAYDIEIVMNEAAKDVAMRTLWGGYKCEKCYSTRLRLSAVKFSTYEER